MTNTELLEKRIAESGKKKTFLAEKVGLSRAGFRNCVTNKAEFTATQIDVLCAELGITSLKERFSIFFAKSGS
jgi:plasmid maintenance system antidote protein VapI